MKVISAITDPKVIGPSLASLARLKDAAHPARPRHLQTSQGKSLTAVVGNLEGLAPATIKSPDA
jgi:hypothetical protein